MKKTIMTVILISILSAGNAFAIETDAGEIHGFLSQGYLKSDDNNYYGNTEDGTFHFREMGINCSTWITSGLRGGFQFVLTDLGDTGNNEVYVDWAYLDYHWQPWLGVRAGRIKKPYGLYNETRDVDMLRTSIFLPQSIYFETFRENQTFMDGGGIYGSVPLNMLGAVSYQALIGGNDIDSDGGIAKTMAGFLQTSLESAMQLTNLDIEINDFDTDTMYDISLEWQTPLEGLRFVWTQSNADMDIETDSFYLATTPAVIPVPWPPGTEAVTIDSYATKLELSMEAIMTSYSAEYVWNDLTLAVEYMSQKLDFSTFMDFSAIINTSMGPMPAPDAMLPEPEYQEAKQEMWGYYYGASYQFFDWFELGTYYSVFYTDRDDKSGSQFGPDLDYQAWLKDICLSLRFNLTDNWILKLEGHDMDGAAFMNPIDNPMDENGERYEQDWKLYAAKVTFHF